MIIMASIFLLIKGGVCNFCLQPSQNSITYYVINVFNKQETTALYGNN